ncbi:thiolase family protein [Stetteria hydrogenophila]
MARVYVESVGLVRVGRHFDKSLRGLAFEAASKALEGAGGSVDYIVASSAIQYVESGQLDVAGYIAGYMGLHGVGSLAVEAGEASGLAALKAAYSLIASGEASRVLVVGVDKLTDFVSSHVYRDMQSLYDTEVEAIYNIGHAAHAGLQARLYMEEYGVSRETLSYWPAMMHSHAKENPYAMLRFAIDPGAVAKAMPVADPLTLLDSFPLGDGAAAVVLAAGDVVDGHPLAELVGVESAVGPYSFGHTGDPLRVPALEEAGRRAVEKAGLPDVVEVIDTFTIKGLLSLEALGIAPRGKAAEMVAEGRFTVGGEGPIVNPSGGCKARGHPVGATGVYQAAEVALQLAGRFEGVRAEDARVGLAAGYNAIGSSAFAAVFRRV